MDNLPVFSEYKSVGEISIDNISENTKKNVDFFESICYTAKSVKPA